jgi:hypothetical protein
MLPALPYDEIIASTDRRWTLPLLARLQANGLADDERAQLGEALCVLDDPRSLAPLLALLVDPTRPTAMRQTAGSILRDGWYTYAADPKQVRIWWQSDDAVLRAHALWCMDAFTCPDLLRQVAATPGHPDRASAINLMVFHFQTAADCASKLAALSAPEADVRAAAADVFFFDESICAQAALIHATADTDDTVVVNALRSLQHYRTGAAVRATHALREHPNPAIQTAATDAYAEQRHDLLSALCRNHLDSQRGYERLRRWLDPVWNLLAFTHDELHPPPSTWVPSPPRPAISVAQVKQFLRAAHDPGTPKQELCALLHHHDWTSCSAEQQAALRPVWFQHPDVLVRESGARILTAWQDRAGVVQLAQDAAFTVRKTAIYHLQQFAPDLDLARIAWTHLLANPLGVTAFEALETYMHHADPHEAIPRLFGLAQDDQSEHNLRGQAVSHLAYLGARNEIAHLRPLIYERPVIAWTLPLDVLSAHWSPNFDFARPDVAHLEHEDHLDVQTALADLDDLY